MYNVKKEVPHKVTQKVIHSQTIYQIFHILGILTHHTATSQLAKIKSQMSGVYMIRKNRKRRENYLEIGSKCATIYIPYTHSQQFQFFDYIPKFRC